MAVGAGRGGESLHGNSRPRKGERFRNGGNASARQRALCIRGCKLREEVAVVSGELPVLE